MSELYDFFLGRISRMIIVSVVYLHGNAGQEMIVIPVRVLVITVGCVCVRTPVAHVHH